MIRLAVIWHRLGPYHHARLRAAAQRVELTAIEMSGEDNTNAWDKVTGSDGFRRLTIFAACDCDTRLHGIGIALSALYVLTRVRYDIGGRYSIVVLPLAIVLYMMIKRGRRWPAIPASALVAALIVLLVARGAHGLT